MLGAVLGMLHNRPFDSTNDILSKREGAPTGTKLDRFLEVDEVVAG